MRSGSATGDSRLLQKHGSDGVLRAVPVEIRDEVAEAISGALGCVEDYGDRARVVVALMRLDCSQAV